MTDFISNLMHQFSGKKDKKEEKSASTDKDGSNGTEGSEGSEGKKKGTLTLFDLILMGLANIVGAGIFVILGKSIKYGGNKSLYALLVVSFISFVMGFCYIEIYSRFKSSITEYLVVQETLGENAGQLTLYLVYLFALFSGVTIVVSITKYLTANGLLSQFGGSSLFQKCFSIFLLIIMSVINYMGIETSKIVANTISITMLLVLGTIILLSLRFISFENMVSGPSVPWDSFVLSAILSLFLFNGYDFLVKISDESIDPENNKVALVATLSITTLIYIAIIVAALCVLKYKTAVSTYNIITKLYEVLINKNVAGIVFVVGAFIMANTAFLSILSATKFMQGLGNDKKIMFSEFWAASNQNGSPTNAIWVSLLITILLAILNNEVLMAVFTNTSCMLILSLISVSLLLKRWSERNDLDAQKMHNYIWGNISNIPVVVVANLFLLMYVMFVMIKDKFWIGKI
jgi:APA family basic amino acid/polyamine antiporter